MPEPFKTTRTEKKYYLNMITNRKCANVKYYSNPKIKGTVFRFLVFTTTVAYRNCARTKKDQIKVLHIVFIYLSFAAPMKLAIVFSRSKRTFCQIVVKSLAWTRRHSTEFWSAVRCPSLTPLIWINCFATVTQPMHASERLVNLLL